jgi:hypothetical protein
MSLRCLMIALIFLAAIVSDSAGQSRQPTQTQEVKQSKSRGVSENNAEKPVTKSNEPQAIIPEGRSPNLKEEASNRSNHSAEEASEYWPFLIFGTKLKITDSLLALFTLLLVLIGAWQGYKLKRTVDLAREEFIATHRPKIKIHAVEVRRTEVGENVFLGASILAFNIGESVAKNVEVRGQIFMGPNFALDVARPIVKTIPEVSSGQKLRAEINSDCQVSYAAAARRTGVIFYCIGWIAYWDESGQRRETGFCFQPEFSNEGDRWVSANKPEYDYDY